MGPDDREGSEWRTSFDGPAEDRERVAKRSQVSTPARIGRSETRPRRAEGWSGRGHRGRESRRPDGRSPDEEGQRRWKSKSHPLAHG